MSARRVIASDCALIVGAWLAFLVILAMLQWLGQGVGFDVWPMGEDRLGVWAIQQPSAGSAASLTWQQLDDRNPLSPWWYVLFRTLILDLDCGLLLLRYAVGLGLALISYALVVSLGGLRSRPFALGLGIVVALFLANHYVEQVYWDREIALICSLATIIFYVRFVESGRQDYPRYGLSLVLWFLAFTTYTVQCGAILAVAYIAFTRPAGSWRLSSGLRVAFVDTLPYGLLFVLYLLVWRTVALRPETYVLHPDFGKLLLSLRYGLLHYDVQEWAGLLLSGSFNLAYIGVACGVGLLVVSAMLSVRSEHNEIATPRTLARHFLCRCSNRPSHCGSRDDRERLASRHPLAYDLSFYDSAYLSGNRRQPYDFNLKAPQIAHVGCVGRSACRARPAVFSRNE